MAREQINEAVDPIDYAEIDLSAVSECIDRYEKLCSRIVQILQMSDEHHPSFRDSGADIVQEIWTDDILELCGYTPTPGNADS